MNFIGTGKFVRIVVASSKNFSSAVSHSGGVAGGFLRAWDFEAKCIGGNVSLIFSLKREKFLAPLRPEIFL